jgi:lipopolysaccharide export system protein LptA
MAVINVLLTDTINAFREKVNNLSIGVGDLANIAQETGGPVDVADSTNLVAAINALDSYFGSGLNTNAQDFKGGINELDYRLENNDDSDLFLRMNGGTFTLQKDNGDSTFTDYLVIEGGTDTSSTELSTTTLLKLKAPAVEITSNLLTSVGNLSINPKTTDDNTGTVIIKGNLTVDGLTTTINSTTLTVDDKNIVLASGAEADSDADGAGITIDGADATMLYVATGDKFVFNKPIHAASIVATEVGDTEVVYSNSGTLVGDENFTFASGVLSVGDTNIGDRDISVASGNLGIGGGTTLKFETSGSVHFSHDIPIRPLDAEGENAAGNTLVIQGGKPLGSGVGGPIKLQNYTSATVAADALVVNGDGKITIAGELNATNLLLKSTNDVNITTGDVNITTGESKIIQFNIGSTSNVLNITGNDTSAILNVNDGDILTLTKNTATVAGTLYSTGDIVAYSTSDERLKDNIESIPDAVSKVNAIRGVSFNWNDNQSVYTGRDIGVVAQEIEAIFPELVSTRENGYKAVKYEKLVAVLIEAVKELSTRVNDLESR